MSGRGRFLTIVGAYALTGFLVSGVIVLDVQVGSNDQQIAQLQARVTRLERPHVRLTAAIGVPACPAPMACTYKPQMIIDTVPGTDGHSQWAVADGYGAPIAWVNGITAGFYFLGDGTGHRGVRGEHICITYNLVAGHEAACLLSDGTLELRATGPGGSLGPPEFLTARDIRWIHAHGG